MPKSLRGNSASDPSQVGRILKRYGFSLQKPALRASQRDEEAIRDCATGAAQS